MKTFATNPTTKEKVTIIAPVTVLDVSITDDGNGAAIAFEYSEWNKEERKEETKQESIMFYNTEKMNYASRLKKLDLVNKKIMIKFAESGERTYGREFYLPNSAAAIPYINKDGEEGKARVFFGYIKVGENATRTTTTGKKLFSFSMHSSVKSAETGNFETEWINMTCWNNPDAALADRAEKVLRDGDLIAAKFGSVKANTGNNGKIYKSASVYQFDLCEHKKPEGGSDNDATAVSETAPAPAANKKSATPNPSAASNPAPASLPASMDVGSLFSDDEDDDNYPF